ncbi:hypothetical protein [Vibrio sp. R78045]|uniref:hypothetical protein n=1 Tax=Vibrio sp. R78045 TaxID=3093868 RepID=UPI0036F26C34
MKKGIELAAELILHKNIVPTYCSSKNPVRDAPLPSDRLWANGFTKGIKNPKFNVLINKIIEEGNKAVWMTDAKQALQFGDNQPPPDNDPRLLAYTRARTKLCSTPHNEYWYALAIGALSRMIAVNGSKAFESDEWSESTFLLFQIESHFLRGKGKEFAASLVELNNEHFDGRLPELIGQNMSHALAEFAVNTFDTKFFN